MKKPQAWKIVATTKIAKIEKENKNMTILITGATGFIGSHLTSRLLADNKPIRALVLPSEPTQADWDNNVEIIL